MSLKKNCFNCRAQSSYFVYDTQHAELTCTICGVVQTNINGQLLYGNNYSYHNPVHTVKHRGFEKLEYDRLGSLYARMTRNICKKEVSINRLHKKIDRINEILDYQERTADHCKLLFKNNSSLRKRKPRSESVAAVLLIVRRKLGFYVNVSKASSLLNMKDLGSHVLSCSKLIKISFRSKIENFIPGFLSQLGFPYKYKKYLDRLYIRYSRENGSMASNTLMGLILWKFYNANLKKSKYPNIKLKDIASMTGTSVTTLSGYIQKQKCTIYK